MHTGHIYDTFDPLGTKLYDDMISYLYYFNKNILYIYIYIHI